MLINLRNKQIPSVLFFVILVFVEMQDQNEYRCLQYKKLLYEENKTISYFHPNANGVSFTEDHCKAVSGFVVGGKDALPKEYPFAARLGSLLNGAEDEVCWFCGGTVVSKYFILTAAHCFYSNRGVIDRVRVGELDFSSVSDDAEPEDYIVQQLIQHPEYRLNLPYNDIGLVVLASAITFNSYKHPACLPPLNIIEENHNALIAIGWGHTKFAGQESSHLQKVTLQPYSYANCAWLAEGREGLDILPYGLQNSLLCAGSSQIKDTCQGDSGGPLLIQHPQYPCMHIIVGITSTGVNGCATPDVPSLYTRVKDYSNWINSYIN